MQTVQSKSTPGKLKHVDIQQVITRISNGEMAVSIAQELGVSRQALSQQLKKIPDYRSAIEEGIESMLDDGLSEMSSAPDLDSVRACEARLRRIEWRAEREFPHRWGNKQQIDLTGAVNVEHLVALKAESLLESIRATQQCEVIEGESTKDGVSY